jgi:hypothetical protein
LRISAIALFARAVRGTAQAALNGMIISLTSAI